MTLTSTSSGIDVEVLNDAIGGVFADTTQMAAGRLKALGVIIGGDDMPHGRGMIGKTIEMPRFGILPDFDEIAESAAAVPYELKDTSDTATVTRASLSFEVSGWRQGSGVQDPYAEAARQVLARTEVRREDVCMVAAAATPLVSDVYSSTVPVYFTHSAIVEAMGMLDGPAAAVVVHPRTYLDILKNTDAAGHLIKWSELDLPPLIQSSRMPITGSTMGTFAAAPSSSAVTPALTWGTNTPLGNYKVRIKVIVGGARGTWTFKFSTNNGGHWSETLTSAATVSLIDTTADSLVGRNGKTGLVLAIATGTAVADEVSLSTGNVKATSLVVQAGAIAHWRNGSRLRFQTQQLPLYDSDVAAMHYYSATTLLARRAGGSTCGVAALKHNVSNYIG